MAEEKVEVVEEVAQPAPSVEEKPSKKAVVSKPRMVVATVFFGLSLAMFVIGLILFLTGKSISAVEGLDSYYRFESWRVFTKGTFEAEVINRSSEVIGKETLTVKPFAMTYSYLICVLAYIFNLCALTTHKTAFKVFGIIFSVINSALLVVMLITILLTINGTFTACSPMNGFKIGSLFSLSSTLGIVAAAVAPSVKKQ